MVAGTLRSDQDRISGLKVERATAMDEEAREETSGNSEYGGKEEDGAVGRGSMEGEDRHEGEESDVEEPDDGAGEDEDSKPRDDPLDGEGDELVQGEALGAWLGDQNEDCKSLMSDDESDGDHELDTSGLFRAGEDPFAKVREHARAEHC